MTGERWPDKRARAVLYAGANRLHRDANGPEPDATADTGIALRDLLFVDAEVREENADTKAHRIGYAADCMQFATLEPAPDGLALSLWVGTEHVAEAEADLGAEPHENPFRRMYGWVRIPVRPGQDVTAMAPWIGRAAQHAADTKRGQHVSM